MTMGVEDTPVVLIRDIHDSCRQPVRKGVRLKKKVVLFASWSQKDLRLEWAQLAHNVTLFCCHTIAVERPSLFHTSTMSIFGNFCLLQAYPIWSFKLDLTCITIIVHISFAYLAFLLSYFNDITQFSIGESPPLSVHVFQVELVSFPFPADQSHPLGYIDWFRNGHMA